MSFPTIIGEIQFLRRKSYTRYEIDLDLLRRGYDPLEIEAAWYTINLPIARPVKLTANLRFWLVLVGYVVGSVLIFFLLNFMLPGIGTGFLVILSLWIISSVRDKFLGKWDKAFSRWIIFGMVVFGCGMNVMLFMSFFNMFLLLSNCRGSCYP
jgi:hypothetical protein